MKEDGKKLLLRCSHCGAEITKVNFGNMAIELCGHCQGLFVDYAELKSPLTQNFEHHPAKQRKDIDALDGLTLECPNCGRAMRKRERLRGRGPFLDLCPFCQGIGFDPGELFRYRRNLAFFEKSEKMKLRLICEKCDLVPDYEAAMDRMKNALKCPRCGQRLIFEGIGEVVAPKIRMRFLSACASFIAGMGIVYPIFLQASESHRATLLWTGTVGAGCIFILIRALIYGNFVLRSGPPGVIRDFDLPDL